MHTITRPNDFLNEIVIVRGHPGSGKTVFAKAFEAHGYKHFENDSFFVGADGVYKFDFAHHQTAKDHCIKQAIKALDGFENVVVSNTFTTLAEMEPLISFAKEMGFIFRVFEMENDFDNVHDVPAAVVADKKAKFERFETAVQIKGDYKVI